MTATTDKLPQVGIIAVNLASAGPALRHVWIDQDTLLVAHDPQVLPHDLVARLVQEQIGDHHNIDDDFSAGGR
ncbi:hypothetical protein [Kitasatospora sp. GP82]|uniref:hypothetical protein n=1 Tax=Kitasatospora sp. GP82 TaxID=3035089 RepID=UPI002475B7B7|nr:hypothetical protein [Kitasatospora sp. GP82]MDH6125921.1 hypothetical protein [Kitasatospora sp. GP82]